jgi:hypothetical protein
MTQRQRVVVACLFVFAVLATVAWLGASLMAQHVTVTFPGTPQ